MTTSGFGTIKQAIQPTAAMRDTGAINSAAVATITTVKAPACPPSATAVAAPAQFRPGPAAAGEFARMVGAAALSGLVFSLVTGLLVFLVANNGHLDAGPSQEGVQISARP